MKKTITRLAAACAAVAMLGTVTACSSQKGADAPEGSDTPAATAAEETEAAGDEAGFREEPVGDEVFEGPLKVAAVYFQPVVMEPVVGVPHTEASMHLEADIAAVPENGLGYGAGDFIPGLTVEYKILDKENKEVQAGTFMPMNASDGPHYGLNLPKLDAGVYTLQFIIHSPEENGWLLHTDKETGVPNKFWTEPIVAEFKDWNWDPAAAWW
ncbi:MAG: iron transporter [Actinomycetaceae bacterium]|nr:iron transporter [Actinomycetaceae bacterium]